MFRRLFSDGHIGSMKTNNRIVMAPMGSYLAENGAVTQLMIDYYVARARGGAGLIVVEAAYPRIQGYLPNRLWINDDRFIPGFKRLVDAIHEAGSKVVLQVNSRRGREDAVDPVSASGVPPTKHYRGTGMVPRILSTGDVDELITEFVGCTSRVKKAGFDGIMIHGGHGYLICEFLSHLTNLRNDKYGGSLENRAKVALELVAGTKQVVGNDYPLIMRLSADDHRQDGFGIRDATAVSLMLEKAGVDAIDVVSGMLETYEWSVPPGCVPRGYNIPLAAEIKKAVKIPVMVAGRINDPYLAEKTIEEGKADFISMGRALLIDPDFPNKARAGNVDDILKCIACDECTNTKPREKRKIMHLLCSMNPAVGREKDFEMKSARKRKQILVIGGGPAGLETAVIAAQRGHNVTLWEKENKLGGQLNLAVIPPFKEEINNAIDYFIIQTIKQNVNVLLKKKGTPASIKKLNPDVVVVAVGSSPIIPNIPGINRDQVITAHDVLRFPDVNLGQDIVVIGGGLVGCETAEYLADRDKRVTIVEMLKELASEVAPFERWFLLPRLESKGIRVLMETKAKEITDHGIVTIDKDGNEVFIMADCIVLAVGAKPNRDLYAALQDSNLKQFVVGDCISGGKIMDAIHDGANVGLAL